MNQNLDLQFVMTLLVWFFVSGMVFLYCVERLIDKL